MITPQQTLDLTKLHESTAGNTFRLGDQPPVFVRGEGALLFDASGKRFVDLVSGSATTSLGYAHPAHRAAVVEVLETGILHTGTRLPSPFRAQLYDRLTKLFPARLDTVLLANSGAEANEAAMKAAQFATGRHRIVAFEGGYHGRTVGALSVTDGVRIRASFSLLDTVDQVPFARSKAEVATALVSLETTLAQRARQGTPVAAVIIEAVQAVSGLIEPPASFLIGVERLTREAGALLIVDEIWNGIGRTGSWFAFERSGLVPDMVTLGKGLSGGVPLSAVVGPASILKSWSPGMHTSTFQGNPVACAMAVATLETIARDQLLERVRSNIEPVLNAALAKLGTAHGVIATRVVGAQAAIQLKDAEAVAAIQSRGIEHGLLLYGGGKTGECLMLIPPLIIAPSELEAGLSIVLKLLMA